MVLSFFGSVSPSVLPLLLLRLWDRPVSGGLGASVHVSDTHYGGKKKKNTLFHPPPFSPNNSNTNIVSDHPSSAASSQGAMVGRPGPCRFRKFPAMPAQPSPAQLGQHLHLQCPSPCPSRSQGLSSLLSHRTVLPCCRAAVLPCHYGLWGALVRRSSRAAWAAWLHWLRCLHGRDGGWPGATGRALEVLWKAARILPCRMHDGTTATTTRQMRLRDMLPAFLIGSPHFATRTP